MPVERLEVGERLTPEQDFLSRIVEARRRSVARAKLALSFTELRERAYVARRNSEAHALRRRLAREGVNVIAEIKRASPSKGELRTELDPASLARAYERGGAASISVLTEEKFFRGSLEDLRAVRASVALPLLRKDFTIDEWQIYEAAAAGADAVLLIVAALDDETLVRLRRVAEDELGLDALVEVHDREEMRRAEACGALLVGVNNRNLRTFEVSLETSVELASATSSGALLVSESGLGTRDALLRLRSIGYSGFLIGETLMRAEHPDELLRELTGGL